jgi:lipoprotein-releasing system permease protein
MFGPFERAVAGRYLRARKGERFVSIIAVFSLVGIALGVATLIVVTSVMSGFQTQLESRILGINGHITIEAYAGDKIGGAGAGRPGAADHRSWRCAWRAGARHDSR